MTVNIETDFDTKKQSFLRLKSSESSQKLRSIVAVSQDCSLWKKDSGTFYVTCSELNESESGEILGLKTIPQGENPFPKQYEDDEFYFYFLENGVEYFAKIKIQEIVPNTEINFVFKSHIYKLDQRATKRFQTAPNHEVYSFFPLAGANKEVSNLLLLNKPKDDLIDFFIKFKQTQYEDKFSDRAPLDIGNYIGFRIQDLSVVGFSILANEIEKGYFSRGLTNFRVVLSVNGQRVDVENANVVYINPYEYPSAHSLTFYRIGFRFSQNNDVIKALPQGKDKGSESVHKFKVFLED